MQAPPHPAPPRTDERPTIDEPAQAPSVEAATETPALEQTVLADRAQPSQLVSPLPDVDAIDGGAAALLSTAGTAPRPRRRGDHQPNGAIADAPSSTSRRSMLWTSTTLALPPDRVRTHGGPRFRPHERSTPSRLQARARHAGTEPHDPLVSLLQVLDGRGPDAAYRALLERVAAVSADANEARIASDVFDRIAGEAERLASLPTIVPAIAEPPVQDIVDTIAASEAPLPEPAIVVAGRFLPMHLLDVLDGDVIDPAGALPVQALLVRPSVPAPDARPIHELLPLQTIVEDSRSSTPASIAALRSFFDDRSAMRIAEPTEVASRTTSPPTAVATPAEAGQWMAFETLDFPPLFEEPPAFAKLQVQVDTMSAAKTNLVADSRPSISFDIFDPKLDLPAAALQDRPIASVQPAPREALVDPLLGMLALADSKLDDMRGGFETNNGLQISFGIERAVYVNGSLVTTTSLNVADLSRLTAGQAQSMGIDRATLGVIQSGANNTFTPTQLSSGNVATVIQNTLNDQKIQGITQINATVNSLDMIRRSDVQSRIQSALTDSIRR